MLANIFFKFSVVVNTVRSMKYTEYLKLISAISQRTGCQTVQYIIYREQGMTRLRISSLHDLVAALVDWLVRILLQTERKS